MHIVVRLSTNGGATMHIVVRLSTNGGATMHIVVRLSTNGEATMPIVFWYEDDGTIGHGRCRSEAKTFLNLSHGNLVRP